MKITLLLMQAMDKGKPPLGDTPADKPCIFGTVCDGNCKVSFRLRGIRKEYSATRWHMGVQLSFFLDLQDWHLITVHSAQL
jgi:hypothetical protein